MAALIGQFLGALLITGLLSRVFFRLVKTWDGGRRKIVLVNAMSLIVCSFVGGMGFANDGAFAGAYALSIYTVPQMVWMISDLLRYRKPDTTNALALPQLD